MSNTFFQGASPPLLLPSCKPAYQPPYKVIPNCLRSVGCQIVSVVAFLTGASAKSKQGHMKRYAVALSI